MFVIKKRRKTPRLQAGDIRRVIGGTEMTNRFDNEAMRLNWYYYASRDSIISVGVRSIA